MKTKLNKPVKQLHPLIPPSMLEIECNSIKYHINMLNQYINQECGIDYMVVKALSTSINNSAITILQLIREKEKEFKELRRSLL